MGIVGVKRKTIAVIEFTVFPQYSNSLFVNKCYYYTNGKIVSICVMAIDFMQKVYVAGCETRHARMCFITLQWPLNCEQH